MAQPPTPTEIRHLLGEHHRDLLAQLTQPQTYTEERSTLRHFPCEQAVGSYLRFFGMLRLEQRPKETPRPSPESVAHTLGTISRAVARLCATTNESRVALFDLVDEMEAREQQLLHATALLRHTLKTLHHFMATHLTGEAAHPAVYVYDTQNVHLSMLNHLTEGLAKLTAME